MKNFLKIVLLVFSALTIALTSCRPPELESAVMEFNKKRYENAKEKAFEATQKFPKNAEAWWYYGVSTIETAKTADDYKTGNDALLKAKEVDPVNYGKKVDDFRYSTYGMSFNQGVNYFNSAGKFTGDSLKATVIKAIEKTQIAAIFNDKNYQIYNVLARCYGLLEDKAKSAEYYKKEYDIAPDSLQTEFDYGYFLFSQKQDYKAAIPVLEMIINNPRTDKTADDYKKDTFLLLSQAYQLTGQKDKAEKSYINAVEKNPDNNALPYNLALIFYQDKRYDEAGKYFKISAERGYESADAYIFGGNSFNLSGKYQEAADVMKKGLDLFPDSGQLWSEYSKALAHLNKKKEAEDAYNKAKKLGIE